MSIADKGKQFYGPMKQGFAGYKSLQDEANIRTVGSLLRKRNCDVDFIAVLFDRDGIVAVPKSTIEAKTPGSEWDLFIFQYDHVETWSNESFDPMPLFSDAFGLQADDDKILRCIVGPAIKRLSAGEQLVDYEDLAGPTNKSTGAAVVVEIKKEESDKDVQQETPVVKDKETPASNNRKRKGVSKSSVKDLIEVAESLKPATSSRGERALLLKAQKSEEAQQRRCRELEDAAKLAQKKQKELETKAQKAALEADRLKEAGDQNRASMERMRKDTATMAQRYKSLEAELETYRKKVATIPPTTETTTHHQDRPSSKSVIDEHRVPYQQANSLAVAPMTHYCPPPPNPYGAFYGNNQLPQYPGAIHMVTAPQMQLPSYYAQTPNFVHDDTPTDGLTKDEKRRLNARRRKHHEMNLAVIQASINAHAQANVMVNQQTALAAAQVNLRHSEEEEAILG
jgi:hypothetical protein